MARALPAPHLRPFVREYVGWWDFASGTVCRREPPGDLIPVIINFGSPVRIYGNAAQTIWQDFGSFTTGLFDTYALVRTSAGSGGLQINLTIAGARLVLGRPLGELLNRAVSLDDLFGRAADRLADRLHDAPDWASRFAIAEAEITRRLAATPPPPAAVMASAARLLRTAGQLAIGSLAADAGCSQKHLVAQFTRELGVTPKVLARVLRFDRAVAQIRRGRPRLIDIAHDCGYYDQSHFDRDFRRFAGVTPSGFQEEVLGAGGGRVADR